MNKKFALLLFSCYLNFTFVNGMQSMVRALKKSARTFVTKGKRTYSTHRKPGYGFLWTPYEKKLFVAATIPVQKYDGDSIEHYINERYLQKIKRTPIAGVLATSLPMSVEKRSLLDWIRINSYGVTYNDLDHPVNAEGIASNLNTTLYALENNTQEFKDWPLVSVQHWLQPVFIISDEPLEHTKNSISMDDSEQKSITYNRYLIHPIASGISLKEYYQFLDNLNPRLSRAYSSLTHHEAMIVRATCQRLLVNALMPNTFDHGLQEIIKQ